MIAIIGGSCFIGTRLSSRLDKSRKSFQIVDKVPSGFSPKNVLIWDIRFPLSISFSEEPSALINLAAEHRDDISPITSGQYLAF